MSPLYQYTGRRVLSERGWKVIGWVSEKAGPRAAMAVFVMAVFFGFTKPVYRCRIDHAAEREKEIRRVAIKLWVEDHGHVPWNVSASHAFMVTYPPTRREYEERAAKSLGYAA